MQSLGLKRKYDDVLKGLIPLTSGAWPADLLLMSGALAKGTIDVRGTSQEC